MEYFDFTKLNEFLNDVGKTYKKDSDSAKWYMSTRSKLQHLITLLSSELDIKLINNYNEKPNRLAGQGRPLTLKPYILAGFVPVKYRKLDEKAFIKLSFYPGADSSFTFGIDIDVNFSDKKNPYLKERETLQQDTSWAIPVNDKFPSNWESLLHLISSIVKEKVDYFEIHFGRNKANNDINEPTVAYQTSQLNVMYNPLNQILFGPPGTGKTYNTINTALEIIGENIIGKTRKEIKALFDSKMKEGQIVFTTFHQSMSYEDFIEGIKPETLDNKVIYNVRNGIFKNICLAALTPNQVDFNDAYNHLIRDLSETPQIVLQTPTGREFSVSLNSNGNLTLHTGPEKVKQGTLTKEKIQKQINGEEMFVGWEGYFSGVVEYLKSKYKYSINSGNQTQNFVLIIDEINRGNVSQIFGELITLVEDDKRLGKEEELEVILPYSKERFGVPSNLYIIGTMNTADRSVEALDTALRRRFDFKEMAPDATLIAKCGKLQPDGRLNNIDLVNLLNKINARIEKLLDKDHLIGHSFFIQVDSIEKLKEAFQNKIIPLLQEYFYGDFGKIGLVLGSGFVKVKTIEKSEILFATPLYDIDVDSFEEKLVFELVDYTKTGDESNAEGQPKFEEAIALLLQ